MLKIATIVPTAYLGFTDKDEYFMCLAHLIGGGDQFNPYSTFFLQKAAAKNTFVIMDNGAAEGAQPEWNVVYRRARLIQPQEIILPDTIYDQHKTCVDSRLALIQCMNHTKDHPSLRYMAVPQGNNLKELVACAREMVKWPIHTLGISKFITPKGGYWARMQFLEALRDDDEIWRYLQQLDIHLLGCWTHPMEIYGTVKALAEHKERPIYIRSTDSAIAFNWTKRGADLMADDSDRPDQHTDFDAKDIDIALLGHNIYTWRSLVQYGK